MLSFKLARLIIIRLNIITLNNDVCQECSLKAEIFSKEIILIEFSLF